MTNSIHLPLQLFTCNQIISVEDTIQLEMDPEPGSRAWIKWIRILDQMDPDPGSNGTDPGSVLEKRIRIFFWKSLSLF